MTPTQAFNTFCPFRSNDPTEKTCVAYGCMAWKTTAYDKSKPTPKPADGICKLMDAR